MTEHNVRSSRVQIKYADSPLQKYVAYDHRLVAIVTQAGTCRSQACAHIHFAEGGTFHPKVAGEVIGAGLQHVEDGKS